MPDFDSLPDAMTIHRAGANRLPNAAAGVVKGGHVVETLLASKRAGDPTAMVVDLDAASRSTWHYHPAGQILYVLEGSGLVQRDGGPVVPVGKGDCVWFAPGEQHWHAASSNSALRYLSVQSVADGIVTIWAEPSKTEQAPN